MGRITLLKEEALVDIPTNGYATLWFETDKAYVMDGDTQVVIDMTAGSPIASELVRGISRLATQSEVDEGVLADAIVTAETLKASAAMYELLVPDRYFRELLSTNYGINSLEELNEYDGIITSLAGDPHLTNITGIGLAHNVTQIDIRGGHVKLVGDLTGLTSCLDIRLLETQDVEYTGNLSLMSDLLKVQVYNNKITSVGDFTGNTTIQVINIGKNLIETVGDVTLCVALDYLRLYRNPIVTFGSVANMLLLKCLYVYYCLLEQVTLETMLTELHANRVALGALGCEVYFVGNPGTEGAALSRATEMIEMNAAGMDVSATFDPFPGDSLLTLHYGEVS